MSVEDKIQNLAEKAKNLVSSLETEEATKNALVMPFIAALGYDVFNPNEVVPEFTADVGTKKGEKVDYLIKVNGEPAILVEAKKAGVDLGAPQTGQLYRYFSVTPARIAILTNGIEFRFFSDIDAPNKMDDRPFLELNLLDVRPEAVADLHKMTKEAFDLDTMLSAAGDLKNQAAISKAIEEQIANPEEEFVRFFFKKANPTGMFSQGAKDQFAGLVKSAFAHFISDKVSQRLRTALSTESGDPVAPMSAEAPAPEEDADGIVTTEEEIHGFQVVKAIVCSVIDPERVAGRDAKSYFAVLADDNNRRPICRLHFNRAQKYVGLFNEAKEEQRIPIATLDEIYKHADALRETASRYNEAASSPAPEAS